MTATATAATKAGSVSLWWLFLALLFATGTNNAVALSLQSSSSSAKPSTTAARRQALIEKSKELNQKLASSMTIEQTWSNRPATVLTPVILDDNGNDSNNIYSADRPFLWNSIDVGGRMAVVALPSTSNSNKPDLWVHSPVAPDPDLLAVLESIGTVKYVVAPNYEHLKYSPAWNKVFPDAQMWACPGLMERMDTVQWQGEIPFGIRPDGWKGTSGTGTNDMMWDMSILEPLHIDCEINPFTGKPFFNEVIFFHKPTKSLIVTDFYWNYPADTIPNKEHGQDDAWELAPTLQDNQPIPLKSRLWKFGMDQVYAPFYKSLMVNEPQKYQDICRHILDEWQVENIVPAHGDIIRGKELCRNVLSKFLLE